MLAIQIWQKPYTASYKWKEKCSWLNKERKKLYAEVAKIYSKNLLSLKLGKEKEISAYFIFLPQTTKIMTIGHDKCLVKMEKALNLYKETFLEWEAFT